MNVVCITSKDSVGCSFFDWSINFLSGKTDFFNVKMLKQIPLSRNPINDRNAHGHKKNHPAGLAITAQYADALLKCPSDMHTMYPTVMHIDDACAHLDINHDQLNNIDHFGVVQQYRYQDYVKLVDYCLENSFKVIYVHNNLQATGYFWNTRNLDRQLLKSMPYNDTDHSEQDFHEIFFKDSNQHWTNNVWDTREQMALNLRPFEATGFAEIGITKPHLWIDCQDLWHSTDGVLVDAMKFIGREINTHCWSSWLPIMHCWQAIQRKNLKFHYTLDHIVSSIVNNWYYPLGQLTLKQEAIIQHCLIYKHDLNLKTWDLSQFPPNTQDLHQLLEQNLHSVPAIY